MKTQKKEWKMPELIILVRSNPEEAVLSACKTTSSNGSGATVGNCTSNHYKNGGHPCDSGGCNAGGTS